MNRFLPAAAASLMTSLWAATAWAQPVGERDFWWHPAGGWGHMMFGGLLMIAFWGGIVLLIVLLVRRSP